MVDSLIVSKYTYMFISSKNKHLIYNSRSNVFLEVSDSIYDNLLSCKEQKVNPSLVFDNQTLSLFIDKKIIVSKEDDIIYLLSLQHTTEYSTYSKRRLGLTIVPTLGCNFRCPYCFEEHKRKVVMNPSIIDKLISFINSHSDSRNLDITWYGGELLMAINVINKILSRISKEVDIPMYRHNLITNGHFMTEKTMEIFHLFPLNTIQVTLDGNKERHDSIRKMNNGKGSFERIINNCDYIVNTFPNTQLHIRVNIERSNIDDYYNLSNSLKVRWNNKNVIIYPGFLRIDNETKTAYSCACLDRVDIANMMFDISTKGLLEFPLFPQKCYSKTCAANRLNTFIVGPEGEIYKCWNDVGSADRIVGRIEDSKILNHNLLMKYIVGSKWYNDESCRECFFLPICSGRCSWYTLRNLYNKGSYNLCTCIQKSSGMLNKCLEQYYDTIVNH